MLLKKQDAVLGQRYVLGEEVSRPKQKASIPRNAHLAIIGESNSGKGSVIANVIRQEVETGGEIWFIDLKSGMEAANYTPVLDRRAYTLDEAKELLSDFNADVDARAERWRGRVRTVDDQHERHRLLVIDEAADLIRSGSDKKISDACVEYVRSALSRSRALNCTVIVSTQNPRVSTSLPYRSLLLTTLALRLNSKSEAMMALGEDALQRGARPWQISYNRPGDGYLWDSESNTVKYIHVPFMTDEDIHSLRRPDTDDEAGGAAAGARSWSTSKLWGLLRRPHKG
ncbi:ATP-binding protein [Bifidobacterium moukalabense]|uniref:ATP-binding protein n=1 Tax=Bifidobacterium moukalabense TaxID=1333651 RepID=UPI0010F8F74E|nr:ATP-binding protein [Bifidobacterium moukalabense]